MFKVLFDRLLAFLLIILFLPIFIVVSLWIGFSMGRPIVFCQKRPGYKEKYLVSISFEQWMSEKMKTVSCYLIIKG